MTNPRDPAADLRAAIRHQVNNKNLPPVRYLVKEDRHTGAIGIEISNYEHLLPGRDCRMRQEWAHQGGGAIILADLEKIRRTVTRRPGAVIIAPCNPAG